jgi:hypothetical protein
MEGQAARNKRKGVVKRTGLAVRVISMQAHLDDHERTDGLVVERGNLTTD